MILVGRPKSEVEERSKVIRLDLHKRYDLGEKAGREGGRIAVESGRLASIHSLPQSIEARRRNGCKLVESGHFARILNKGNHARWHINGISKPDTCTWCTAEPAA
jgi:hypothetical protein